MFELNEQHRMVAQMVRKWCEAKLVPAIPALEAGEAQPFDLMRELARTFGLDHLARAGLEKRIAKLRAGEGGEEGRVSGGGMADDPMMPFVLVKELSRISPGFAMGWGVSVGLAGGAIASRGCRWSRRRRSAPGA